MRVSARTRVGPAQSRGDGPSSRLDEVFSTLRVGDIVRTPKGALAIVSRIDSSLPDMHGICLCYPEENRGEKDAWWRAGDGLLLVVRFEGIKRICGIRAGVQKS